MLSVVLEAALRGGILLLAVWILLKVLRVRDPAVEKNTWTLVAGAALMMPLLSRIAGLIAPPLSMIPVPVLPSSAAASTAALTGTEFGASAARIELICALVYAAVTAALLMRFLTGIRIGVRLCRQASTVPKLHMPRIDVRVSVAIRSPASFGSTILLPPAYETWDRETLATVLAHEQAHIRNFDSYRLWTTTLYRAVFWFDPLAHWLHGRLRVLSELTSDEAAAAVSGDRTAYAAILMKLASRAQFARSTVAMADSSSLSRRLKRLLDDHDLSPALTRPWKALLMSTVLIMGALAAVPWAGAMTPVEQRSATLEFHLADEQHNATRAQQSGDVPAGEKLYADRNDHPILLKRNVVATGDEIIRALVKTTEWGPRVDVRLDARGAASMLRTTRENIGQRLAVVYDGTVINDGVIRSAFGPRFEITGLTAAEAHALAIKVQPTTR